MKFTLTQRLIVRFPRLVSWALGKRGRAEVQDYMAYRRAKRRQGLKDARNAVLIERISLSYIIYDFQKDAACSRLENLFQGEDNRWGREPRDVERTERGLLGSATRNLGFLYPTEQRGKIISGSMAFMKIPDYFSDVEISTTSFCPQFMFVHFNFVVKRDKRKELIKRLIMQPQAWVGLNIKIPSFKRKMTIFGGGWNPSKFTNEAAQLFRGQAEQFAKRCIGGCENKPVMIEAYEHKQVDSRPHPNNNDVATLVFASGDIWRGASLGIITRDQHDPFIYKTSVEFDTKLKGMTQSDFYASLGILTLMAEAPEHIHGQLKPIAFRHPWSLRLFRALRNSRKIFLADYMIECLSSGFENVYDENVRLRMMPHFSHYKHDYMRNTDLYGSLKYRATERIKSAKKYVEMLSRLHDSSSKLTNVGFMALIQYITLILAIIGLVIAYTAGKGA